MSRWWLPIAGALVALVLLSACGGGGGDPPPPLDTGWVEIEGPTIAESYATTCAYVILWGSAFSGDEATPYAATAQEKADAVVTWENLEHPELSGTATQQIDFVWIPFFPMLSPDHQWRLNADLADGRNTLRVTARELSGGEYGSDTLTVFSSAGSAQTISGTLSTFDGRALDFFNAGTQVRIDGDQFSRLATPAPDGSYAIGCVPPGTHLVTVTTPLAVSWLPASRTVEVSDADLAGIDFSAGLYRISGTATWGTSGTPMTDLTVAIAGDSGTVYPRTDASGVYSYFVPDGTYTLTPDPFSFGSSAFTPAQAGVTVSGADPAAIDFVRN